MAKVTLRLDTRRKLADGKYPLKIAVSRKGSTVYIPTGRSFFESEWDKELCKVIPLRSNAAVNNLLESLRLRKEKLILDLQDKGELRKYTDKQLVAYLSNNDNEEAVRSLFSTQAEDFLSLKTNNRTVEIYRVTLKHISKFCNYDTLRCADISVSWIREFESYLTRFCPSANTRAIHLRNIRAIINHAIDNEVLDSYPFRRFKIRYEETEKRSLTVEQLRAILNAKKTPTQQKYVDCFFLMFYLIGINSIDLSRLMSIEKGRIKYRRAKTGKLYDIKVEPEALIIINRYRGEKHLLRFFDTNSNYKNFEKKLNNSITTVANQCGIKGRITTYYARHSWATIAASINITKDTISECLGHKYGSEVTSVYINFEQGKKDEANRKVIDFLIGK